MKHTRKLASFLRPYRLWVILAPLMMALEVAMDLLQPRLVQIIIDDGITKSDMSVVVRFGLLMVGVAIVGLIGGMACGVFAIIAAQHFGADVRGALFRKVQSLSFSNLDRLDTGKLVTRLTNDVTQVQDTVALMLRVMVRAPLLLVGSIVMAILTSAQLSLLFLVLVPVIMGIVMWVFRKAFPLFKRVQKKLDGLNSLMQENLAGVRVVRAFARSPHEVKRFSTANNELMGVNLTAVRFGAVVMPAMMLVLNFAMVAVIWIGGFRVHHGGLEIGQLVAFSNYLMQSLMALLTVSMLVVRVSRAEASAERIQEVLVSEPDIADSEHPVTVLHGGGRIEFDDVHFGYEGADGEVLSGVSFTAEPGETVAILGATGSGKSTLVQLIPRFYDVTAGRILVDGIDVREIEQHTLRDKIGIALQEAILFSGTIRDNIRYGKPEASEAEVVTAARMAQAEEFIEQLPERYDAIVGQRGVNLSGGQKQRLAIARALLPRPPILILDDSTSAVDVATESRIQDQLASLRQTRIIVAQRISTVLTADKILLLENGRIVAAGDHDTLLRESPMYQAIFESQMEVVLDGAA
ncbi:MAG: ABC transporter ATP-binding protein [Thermomicrobiales bacterium]